MCVFALSHFTRFTGQRNIPAAGPMARCHFDTDAASRRRATVTHYVVHIETARVRFRVRGHRSSEKPLRLERGKFVCSSVGLSVCLSDWLCGVVFRVFECEYVSLCFDRKDRPEIVATKHSDDSSECSSGVCSVRLCICPLCVCGK